MPDRLGGDEWLADAVGINNKPAPKTTNTIRACFFNGGTRQAEKDPPPTRKLAVGVGRVVKPTLTSKRRLNVRASAHQGNNTQDNGDTQDQPENRDKCLERFIARRKVLEPRDKSVQIRENQSNRAAEQRKHDNEAEHSVDGRFGLPGQISHIASTQARSIEAVVKAKPLRLHNMGKGKPQSVSSKAELLAFHAAMVRIQTEQGTLGTLIPVRDWEGYLVRCLGTMTRQSCQDKTWALDRLGLITRQEHLGVVLEPAT